MATPRKSRGEYRPIFEALFRGKDYRILSPEAKLVLLTLKGLCGAKGIACWPALAAMLAELTGLQPSAVAGALEQLVANAWIEHEDGIVWVVRGLEFEPQVSQGNRKHQAWIARELEALPRAPIVDRFRARYRDFLPNTTENPAEQQSGMGTDSLSDSLSDGLSHGLSDTLCDTTSTIHHPPTTNPLPPSPNHQPPAHSADGEIVQSSVAGDLRSLVVVANQGIAARFGEQPVPLKWDARQTRQFAEALEAARVPLAFAKAKLFEVASSQTPSGGRPPRVMTYFTAAVVDAWADEMVKREVRASPRPITPPERLERERQAAHRKVIIEFANQGDSHAIAECERLGIDYRSVA